MRIAVMGAILGVALVTPAVAQQPVVYPAQGQSAEQQARDQGECRAWAVQQTGFDPAYPPPPPVTGSSGQGGEILTGAARGAVLGLTIGAIAGDAGEGAAAGAAGGALIGGFRRRDQRRQDEQMQSQAQYQYQQQIAANTQAFNRAVAVCLQGRGYTVQ